MKDEEALLQDGYESMRGRSADSVWTLCIQAERDEGPETKGLAIEGSDEASTSGLKSVWKTDEPVLVYLGTECIGTLKATPLEDPHKATLSGTVTTSGITPGTTTLSLRTPRAEWAYTGQVGRLLLADDANNQGDGNRSIEKKYHYTMAENVLVKTASEGSITTDKASFVNQQSIYRMNFRYKVDGSTKTPITTESVTIASAGGHLVQSQAVDGTSLVEGAISVTLGTASADPFFVALRNGDETDAEELSFTVVDTDGVTYKGTKTIPAAYKPNGTFVSMKNVTLDQRLGVSLSATEVTTAW